MLYFFNLNHKNHIIFQDPNWKALQLKIDEIIKQNNLDIRIIATELKKVFPVLSLKPYKDQIRSYVIKKGEEAPTIDASTTTSTIITTTTTPTTPSNTSAPPTPTTSTPITTTTTPTTTTSTDNIMEQLDSIFVTLKKDIENGYDVHQIKTGLRKGMDNLGVEFPGRYKKIEQYVKTKKNEIANIKERHRNLREVIVTSI